MICYKIYNKDKNLPKVFGVDFFETGVPNRKVRPSASHDIYSTNKQIYITQTYIKLRYIFMNR